MAKKLFKSSYNKARGLASSGKVKTSTAYVAISPETEDAYIAKNSVDDFGSWHLGIDPDADKGTKQAYRYAFTSDFETVDRTALEVICENAKQADDDEIFEAALKILDVVDGKGFTPKDLIEAGRNGEFFEIKAEKVEILRGEKAVVHYVSTPDLDRGNDIVDPQGMNDEDFAKSPSVWYNHNYMFDPSAVPVGKSLWRKKQEGGVLAKTQFNDLPFSQDIYNLHLSGDINTWSIGWMPDTSKKDAMQYDPKTDIMKINYWKMFEYSSAPLAMNPNALDQMKRLKEMSFKSLLAKSIVEKVEIEAEVKTTMAEISDRLNALAEDNKRLKELVESQDDSHIEQKIKDILELQHKVKDEEEEIVQEVQESSAKEGLGEGMSEEQFEKLIKDAVAGEFRKIKGLD